MTYVNIELAPPNAYERPPLPIPNIRIFCAKCGRHGRYSRGALVNLVGTEPDFLDALERITADCPKRQSAAAYDKCMALYPDLVAKVAE